MAAYGAVSSLKITIERIRQSSRISLLPPSPQILQRAYEAMELLQEVLLSLDQTSYGSYSKIRTKVNASDERIKEAVWEFEDLLESHVSDQILPQLESSSGGDFSFSVDLQSLQDSVDCFFDRMMEMGVEYLTEMTNMPEEEGEPISSRIDFGGINSNMVGLSQEFEQARDYFLGGGIWYGIIGMAGVGKTTLAKKVFDDPSIQRHFELRAWVKVGRKCEPNEALRCILAQVDSNTYNKMLTQGDDDDGEKLFKSLVERLEGTKCLIVLDDVWDGQLLHHLPAEKNVGILLTSRFGIGGLTSLLVVRLLTEEESKKLLEEKVFGEEGFPPHLEELGEKIAKKCEGLPLMIVTVAELLSKANKSIAQELISNADKNTLSEELKKSIREYWNEVAQKKHDSVFEDAYDQISEVLFPSYDYLAQYLKMLFLYLGTFPPYSDIVLEYIITQLSAEGFLEPTGEQTLRGFLLDSFEKLFSWHHLVLYESQIESWFSSQKFRVHSCWQHVCRKEASKIKFLHVLQSCDDVIKDQRRLCAHCNTLFGFKQVYDSIKSDCGSTVRSLLFSGPYHQYPVPIHAMGLKLLRVLEAFKVRFYHFPLEILKLVCLQHLALTCNRELPASISNLLNLQILIISQHMNIKKCGAESYVPVEIWDMQELRHIYVKCDLPTPTSDATLNKLFELDGVSAKSCTREVLQRIPNLQKLGIFGELKPYDDDYDSNSLNNLDYISEELKNLKVLSYHVVNPDMKYESMIPLSMFPSSLTRLHLRGMGCPWKYMNDIGSLLPNLKFLRLECYAFRGPEWVIKSGCFF